MESKKLQYILTLLRIGMGWIFLWSFLDKLFGLGFATTPSKAWLAGSSPTFGFLKFGVRGPFKNFFQSLAGSPVVDWLFMLGLLLIGLALMLGIFIRLAGYFGALLMLLMWLSLLPPEHNPILGEHIVYLLILLSFTAVSPDQWRGLGKRWSNTNLVKKHPILQ